MAINTRINLGNTTSGQSSNILTDRSKKAAKKGAITDAFITGHGEGDSYLREPALPEDLIRSSAKDDKETDKNLLSMIAVPMGVLGAGAIVTEVMAGVYRKKLMPGNKGGLMEKLSKGVKKLLSNPEKGPVVPPNMNIKTEAQFATYEALRDPSLKKILGAMAVFTYSTAAFVMKNTVDGVKEIWVQKQEANIHRDFQEKMIDIETRSFAGKKQIVRYMLDNKTKEIDKFNKTQGISFKGHKNPDKQQTGIKASHILTGVAAAVTSALLIRKTMKNIREIGKVIDSAIEKTVPDLEKKESSWAPAHEMYGNRQGKPTVFAYLDDVSGHLYNMVMNPSKFTASLFAGFCTLAGLGYTGAKFVEARKETEVKKAKAKIDLDMHDKLVKVELKNFMRKKESAVKPLIANYKRISQKENSDNRLKSRYDNIINEIKNGPPFIYD